MLTTATRTLRTHASLAAWNHLDELPRACENFKGRILEVRQPGVRRGIGSILTSLLLTSDFSGNSRMSLKRILITNDDGITAPGIKALEQSLAALGEVTVIAPDREMSATSQSITLHTPLRIHRIDDRHYGIGGTPDRFGDHGSLPHPAAAA